MPLFSPSMTAVDDLADDVHSLDRLDVAARSGVGEEDTGAGSRFSRAW